MIRNGNAVLRCRGLPLICSVALEKVVKEGRILYPGAMRVVGMLA